MDVFFILIISVFAAVACMVLLFTLLFMMIGEHRHERQHLAENKVIKQEIEKETPGWQFERPVSFRTPLKAEPPKEEPPKEEAPKAEPPKEEAPKAEPPKEEAPKEDSDEVKLLKEIRDSLKKGNK